VLHRLAGVHAGGQDGGNPLPAIPGILTRHGYGPDVTRILLAALLLAATHTTSTAAAAAENGPIAFGSDDALWLLDESMEQRLPTAKAGRRGRRTGRASRSRPCAETASL
jgi:hypothetical protein